MRLVNLVQVQPGARLGQAVFGTGGLPLLTAGVELTSVFLATLRERRVQAVWIEDPDTADIDVRDPISPALRASILSNLGASFSNLAGQDADRASGLRSAYAAVARKEMAATRFADAIRSTIGDGGLNTIARDMDQMLDELKGQQVLAGLNSIKSHDAYTYQHSIDVTIMGLVLARSLGWERWRLKALGVGCMLHDIGKLFVDPEILNKPAGLTPDELAQIRAHPAVGYDVVRTLAPSVGILAAHVAYQHHEKQDGTGYPRGLKGSNSLGRNAEGLIHDVGSIAAVADVYDAMTSARAYRCGWSPARTLAMIRDGAGTHFNRGAVSVLLSAVPPYPVLSEIRVKTGAYAGWRGVVTDVVKHDLRRPTVRLLHRPDGQRDDPVEINLREAQDVEVEACEPSAAPATLAA